MTEDATALAPPAIRAQVLEQRAACLAQLRPIVAANSIFAKDRAGQLAVLDRLIAIAMAHRG